MPGPTSARLLIALAVTVCGGSLALFAAFLFLGPFGLLDLGFSPGGTLIWNAALIVAFCVWHSVMVRCFGSGIRSRHNFFTIRSTASWFTVW